MTRDKFSATMVMGLARREVGGEGRKWGRGKGRRVRDSGRRRKVWEGRKGNAKKEGREEEEGGREVSEGVERGRQRRRRREEGRQEGERAGRMKEVKEEEEGDRGREKEESG